MSKILKMDAPSTDTSKYLFDTDPILWLAFASAVLEYDYSRGKEFTTTLGSLDRMRIVLATYKIGKLHVNLDLCYRFKPDDVVYGRRFPNDHMYAEKSNKANGKLVIMSCTSESALTVPIVYDICIPPFLGNYGSLKMYVDGLKDFGAAGDMIKTFFRAYMLKRSEVRNILRQTRSSPTEMLPDGQIRLLTMDHILNHIKQHPAFNFDRHIIKEKIKRKSNNRAKRIEPFLPYTGEPIPKKFDVGIHRKVFELAAIREAYENLESNPRQFLLDAYNAYGTERRTTTVSGVSLYIMASSIAPHIDIHIEDDLIAEVSVNRTSIRRADTIISKIMSGADALCSKNVKVTITGPRSDTFKETATAKLSDFMASGMDFVSLFDKGSIVREYSQIINEAKYELLRLRPTKLPHATNEDYISFIQTEFYKKLMSEDDEGKKVSQNV